jgi:hypothetical protein
MRRRLAEAAQGTSAAAAYRQAVQGGLTMRIKKEIIEALHEAGIESSSMRSCLSIPGDAATFIVLLSLAGAYEGPSGDETDPRLR